MRGQLHQNSVTYRNSLTAEYSLINSDENLFTTHVYVVRINRVGIHHVQTWSSRINHDSSVRTFNTCPNATTRTQLEHTPTNDLTYRIAVIKYAKPGRFINACTYVS
jgi:hypothetical protein